MNESTTRRLDDTLREVANGLGHGRPAHDIVADTIRHLIAIGGLRPGDRLPPERELAITLGAARVTVRRALKQLGDAGLVSTRRGRSGGTFVAGAPDRGHTAADSLALFQATIDHAFEFRRIVEPPAAELAAQRATLTDREALMLLAREHASTHSEFHELDTRFHLLVARAGANPELQTAIERQRSTFFVLANAVLLPAPYEEFPTFADEHREIAAAIHARDAPRARSEMDAHLTRVHGQFAYALARATAEMTTGDLVAVRSPARRASD
jgi:GntR family transcriptional regulator, transcriptional repressor for pyruvate dehydrogenase complex